MQILVTIGQHCQPKKCVSTVSDNIGGVTIAAGETAESIGQIMSASEDVARQAESMRVVVDDFMAKVSAA